MQYKNFGGLAKDQQNSKRQALRVTLRASS
jgi:hypothetical protein